MLAFQKMRSKYLNKNSFDGKKECFKYRHVVFSSYPRNSAVELANNLNCYGEIDTCSGPELNVIGEIFLPRKIGESITDL